MKFYFTYGDAPKYPFHGGWTLVIAEDRRKAVAAFRAYHADDETGALNCAFVYDQEEMKKTGMLVNGNEGRYCHECIILSCIY